MKLADLKELVSRGEGQHLEFKKKVDNPLKVTREVVAFANSTGGTLLIGVSDDGNLSGLKYPDEEAFALTEALKKYCTPKIDISEERISVNAKKVILKYYIKSGSQKPYNIVINHQKHAFIRIDDKSIRLSKEMSEILKRKDSQKGTHIYFGAYEKQLMEHLEQHGSITIREYINLTGLNRYRASRKLIKMVLANILTIHPEENEDRFSYNEIHAKL